MPRVAVTIEKIKDDKPRKACYDKRKAGLLKKTIELSILTGCTISLVIFDESGTLDIAYSTKNVERLYEEFMDQLRLGEDFKVLDNNDYDNLKNKTQRKRKTPKKDTKNTKSNKNTSNKKKKLDDKKDVSGDTKSISTSNLGEDKKISTENNTFFKSENVVEPNKNFANFSIFETTENYESNSFKNMNNFSEENKSEERKQEMINSPTSLNFIGVDPNLNNTTIRPNEIQSNFNTEVSGPQISAPNPPTRKKNQKKKVNVVPPLSLSQEVGAQNNRAINIPNNNFSNFNVTQTIVESNQSPVDKDEWNSLKTGNVIINTTNLSNFGTGNTINTPFSSLVFNFNEPSNGNIINTPTNPENNLLSNTSLTTNSFLTNTTSFPFTLNTPNTNSFLNFNSNFNSIDTNSNTFTTSDSLSNNPTLSFPSHLTSSTPYNPLSPFTLPPMPWSEKNTQLTSTNKKDEQPKENDSSSKSENK